MNNEEKEQAREHDKFMLFMLTMMGGNVTAPQEIVRKHMDTFKCIRSAEDDDNVIDATVALSKCETQDEKLEAVKILVMQFLTTTDIHRLITFLRDFSVDILGYLRDHEEYREKMSSDDIMKNMDNLLG